MISENNPRRPLQDPEEKAAAAAAKRARQIAAETASCYILYKCGVTFAELCSESRDHESHSARLLFVAALTEAGWSLQGLCNLLQKPDKYINALIFNFRNKASEGEKYVIKEILTNIENALNY